MGDEAMKVWREMGSTYMACSLLYYCILDIDIGEGLINQIYKYKNTKY
jgi:hypothetical protein